MTEFPTLFTIGFTKKSAEDFFGRLREAGVRTLLDIRLRNDSQLAGFAKGRDLPFFLKGLAGIAYRHLPLLAPDAALRDGYKKQKGSWEDFDTGFRALLESRLPEAGLGLADLDRACLLCSEHEPEHCHRRLVAERFQAKWPELAVVHL